MRSGYIPGLPIRDYAGPFAPSVTADAAQGYEEGSNWVDTAAGKLYVCTDASPGEAVWKEIADSDAVQAGGGISQSTLDAALLTKADLAHGHAQGDVTGLTAALAAKAASSHTHGTSEVTGLDNALNGKVATNDPRLSDARTPLSHTHQASDIIGLPSGGGIHNAFLIPVGFYAANLTSVTAFVSASSYFVYVGRIAAAITTADLVFRVTTAGATITWAEVAVFKGSPVANGAASLTRLGFTNVAAVVNSTGVKKVTVALSGVAAGDDLWVAFGAQATTMPVFRALLANDIQSGVYQSAAVRPSLAASPQATTLAANNLAALWCSLKV